MINTPASGCLYLVATPIGNLEDITARALRILREVDLIAAEDTRVTRKLLAHFDIHTPLTSYHAHTTSGKEDDLLARLVAGAKIALVSDAGMPCISDPGAELVALAVEAGVRVEPIPGASASLAALIASGLSPGRFVFEGFLPRTNDRRDRLKEIAREMRTSILYEASPRLVDTLNDLAKVCSEGRRVVVARELTKKFEEFQRGTLAEVAAYYRSTPPRGECVIVLEGSTDNPESETAPDPESLLRDALARGVSPRDAVREIAKQTGLARNELYTLALNLASSTTNSDDIA